MQFSSIWPTNVTLSGATMPGQSRNGSNSNEGVFYISQSSSITGTSPSDRFVSYPGHSLGQSCSRCIVQPQPTEQPSFYHFSDGLVWFLLFNGISTLFRLFNAKAILLEEQSWCNLTHSWEDKGVHTFPKGICPKVNIIVRLEYELAYYDSAVNRFNHYTMRTPPHFSESNE